MKEGWVMVEQQPGIFKEVSNDLDVIEEFTVYTGGTVLIDLIHKCGGSLIMMCGAGHGCHWTPGAELY
jgi:hypothetical protein